jgi:hypothetical protein
MLRTVSRSSQCRPVDDFVLWYGSIRFYAGPVPRRTYVVGYYATPSTTSASATANSTRSCLQHYGYVGSGHYYIAP